MRSSEAVKVNTRYRYWRKAQALLQKIDRRMDWYQKHMPDKVFDRHKDRAHQIKLTLQSEIELESKGEKIACQTNTYYHKTPILKLPVKETLGWIYENLPEPKGTTLTPLEQCIANNMSEMQADAIAREQKFLLMCEMAYRIHYGWFIIFDTLTMAPGQYKEIFGETAHAFQDYIRQAKRRTGQAAYGTVRNSRARIVHTYFACTEYGGKTGRLHIHCIHLLKCLPTDARDPNAGRIRPDQLELECYQSLWDRARSEPRIIRYSPNDAFGRLGYRWPLDPKTGQPRLLESPLRLASYMSKYLKKGANKWHKEEFPWRVKKSRGLGHNLLREIMCQITTESLITISSMEKIKVTLNNHGIPMPLLRQAALRQIDHRSMRNQSYSERASVSLMELAKKSQPRLSPLHSSRASTKTIHENNRQSIGYLQTVSLHGTASYERAAEELRNAVAYIDERYFPEAIARWGASSSRDDIASSPQRDDTPTVGGQARDRRTKHTSRQDGL